MEKKKILILLPDGVGLRNFAYTKFHELGVQKGYDVTFWNNTPFDLTDLGFREIKIRNAKTHFLTEILKEAQKDIELSLFKNRFRDQIYDSYRSVKVRKNFKQRIKLLLVKIFVKRYSGSHNLLKLKTRIKEIERTGLYYEECLRVLKEEKPSFLFCTNQRQITAIAAIEAAKSLGIQTATFIFSWDNIPKASIVLDTDFYFVWSAHMKREMEQYYPEIKSENIIVTGTPQFENYFNSQYEISREDFFRKYNLDLKYKYICYSGDDIKTSPHDPVYLTDVATAIRKLKEDGHKLGVIFRRCPVDFSSRFDDVLQEFNDVITAIDPIWKEVGKQWNMVLPTPEDMSLQSNLVQYTELVVNLGSSMVFDYSTKNKPCFYINYNPVDADTSFWNVETIYKFIHFQSMPNENAVFWLNNRDEIQSKILDIVQNSPNLQHTNDWFEIIVGRNPHNASGKIWETIAEIEKSKNILTNGRR